MTIVTNDEIERIERCPPDQETDLEAVFSSETADQLTKPLVSLDSSAIERRRDQLIDWLRNRNQLPVKLEPNASISILDTVFIRAPYGLDNCESMNEIIMDKVRNLVKSFDDQTQ